LWDDAPRWSGWGPADATGRSLPAAAASLLGRLGVEPEARRPPVALDDVRLPELALPDGVRDRLARVAAVHDDRLSRVVHAAGKSYLDLLRLRAGDATRAPDAVVVPADRAAVGEVLGICAGAGVAVVPFGGGTSVVGGVEPLRRDLGAVVALDLGGIAALNGVDERSLVAVLGAGMRGPAVERALSERGFTLGHFPQSWEYATVGGMVATRSAGQASTGYGRIDELVRGVTLVAPRATLELPVRTPNAAGPDLREVVAGSEGTLGLITEAALSVRPRPAVRLYEGWSFASFETGVEAFRALAQEHVAPDVARLSDEAETAVNTAIVGTSVQGCLAIVGWEGGEPDVERRRAATSRVLERSGGGALGRALDLLRERLPPRLELEHERLRRLAREAELAAGGVEGVAVARGGEAGPDVQELVPLDDPHVLPERVLEHDSEATEALLARLVEQAQRSLRIRRNERRRTRTERRGQCPLVAGRDLELRENEALPALRERARRGRQSLALLQDPLERGEPVPRHALGARGRDLLRPCRRGGRLDLRA
jgi:FAD/FMN-containing dehydrogenase